MRCLCELVDLKEGGCVEILVVSDFKRVYNSSRDQGTRDLRNGAVLDGRFGGSFIIFTFSLTLEQAQNMHSL